MQVRQRVDGLLRDVLTLPHHLQDQTISRRARTTRAGIRLPIGSQMQVFITVVNFPNQDGVTPTVLGTFRTGEATLFSWDVAVQKARTAIAYSNNGNTLAMSTRTVGFLAQSHYPPGIDADRPGPFFGQQEIVSGLFGTAPNVTVNPNFTLTQSA